MESLTTWFSGKTAPDKEPPQSVLSDWKSYQANDGKTNSSSKLLSSAEEGAASFSRLASGAFNSVTVASSSVVGSVQSSIPGTSQWVYFGVFAGTGVFMLMLAFFIFLPMIILSPSKFAVTFSLGSGLILASMGFLRGWKELYSMVKERAPFTAAYIGSLVGTLYASLWLHSYIYSILLCIIQIVTLVYFVASFFPGGAEGAQYVFGALGRGGMSMGSAVLSSFFSNK